MLKLHFILSFEMPFFFFFIKFSFFLLQELDLGNGFQQEKCRGNMSKLNRKHFYTVYSSISLLCMFFWRTFLVELYFILK